VFVLTNKIRKSLWAKNAVKPLIVGLDIAIQETLAVSVRTGHEEVLPSGLSVNKKKADSGLKAARTRPYGFSMNPGVSANDPRPRQIWKLGLLLVAFAACAMPHSSLFAQEPSSTSPARIYAQGALLWIYERPERDPAPLGVLRAGQSVALRAEQGHKIGDPVKKGCGRGWYAVEPAGYVCLDHDASDQPSRYSLNMQELLPREGAHPFFYALSMGTPSYRRVPHPSEWARKERVFGQAERRPLPPHWQGHEELATNPKLSLSPMPLYLLDGGSVSRSVEKRLVRRDVPFGSMLALTQTFAAEGRQFGQSADGTIVPMDRMVVFQPSTFEGVVLDPSAVSLPLGWSRKRMRFFRLAPHPECQLETKSPLIVSNQDGQLSRPQKLPASCLLAEEEHSALRERHPLSGRVVTVLGTAFAEIKSSERWLPVQDLFVAQRQTPPSRLGSDTQEKWIAFSVSNGTLTAYEGSKPVFSTLASPGIGGVPAPNADPLSTRTTPIGTFRITFKYRSDDMSPEHSEHRKFWIAEVPHAMYFDQPFAIHVAYWHQSFGEPMSGGCINVSPQDGKRLFDFTSPTVPTKWYGAGSSAAFGLGTTIVIQR